MVYLDVATLVRQLLASANGLVHTGQRDDGHFRVFLGGSDINLLNIDLQAKNVAGIEAGSVGL